MRPQVGFGAAGRSHWVAQHRRSRLGTGAEVQEDEAAASIRYSRRFGDNLSMSIGAAFSGSENTAGVGFGVDL